MKPAFSRISPVNINGYSSNRLMIVLKTKGCEYALNNNGGCSVCGFSNNAIPNISEEQIISQLTYALKNHDLQQVEEIDLLTLGSFFNDNEISPALRRNLLEIIAELDFIKRVSFESRAEYVTTEKLLECRKILSNKIVELGIGLESADNYIRNSIINKNLSEEDFYNVMLKLKETGYDMLVYLLIKPPSLTEKQAIEDAINSVKYVFERASKINLKVRYALEPVFICVNTKLEDLYRDLKYKPASLWSILEVIKNVKQYGEIFVGMSDEDLSLDRMSFSCDECYDNIIDEIESFNKTNNLNGIKALECNCKIEYQKQLEEGLI